MKEDLRNRLTKESDDFSSNGGRAPRNRTITLTPEDRQRLGPRVVPANSLRSLELPIRKTVHGDCLDVAKVLPAKCVDLLFLDPPYNLTKTFDGLKFWKRSVESYSSWLENIILRLIPLLKETASVYICGDWHTSASIFEVASKHFAVRNRITWEREKGRGAQSNWKNSSEDIWFCTVSDAYVFNVGAVKLRRKVIAPYTNGDGSPKDWSRTAEGNYRDTHPSNLWTDITIPFWSMPENTDHPTQKSEKLLARLVLGSTNSGDFVLDPFLGSGTTSVVAKKLNRNYLGIEVNKEYCLLAEKRLELAETVRSIQGFIDGVFWERNTGQLQIKTNAESEDLPASTMQGTLGY